GNIVTRYAHAKSVLVKVGDRVDRGQLLATVGTSGRSTGPHLHFEVLRRGRAVDPKGYLNRSVPLAAHKS
ncbi:MAG: M23 family metallopeptidase, partial [Gammaproteobacteria bacterium]|nr:M23 family metallopeptidase [Gammaproteobacteria bacterium]